MILEAYEWNTDENLSCLRKEYIFYPVVSGTIESPFAENEGISPGREEIRVKWGTLSIQI